VKPGPTLSCEFLRSDGPGYAWPESAAARPIFMPETFSGVGREWANWAEQFEMAADVNNWDEPLKLKFMCLLLSDKAREVYNGLSGSVKGARTVGQMPAPLSVVETPIRRGNSGYLKARIGGCECQVLIDTGASRSVILRKLWLSFTRGVCELTPYEGNVTAANGRGMCILGCWQTTCQLGPLAFVVEFLVSGIPSDEVLLGFDFLSKHGMVVDLGTKTCKIMGRVFPLLDLEPFLRFHFIYNRK
uniref:Peptidase A2 domain-containing protein n=1 Tax=Nothobranchius furzeri TaxID=105023 RepID=A0A8C6VSP9_NOTFU